MRFFTTFRRITAISIVSAFVLSLLSVSPASAATPNAPSAVTASYSNGSAIVSWTAPTPVSGVTITGYVVTSSPGGLTCDVAFPATSCTVESIASSTSYTFSVVAWSAGGAGPSASSSASTSPTLVTTTTTMSVSPNGPQNVATDVLLTAFVTSGATGTVEFVNGSTAIAGCAFVALTSGYAECSTTALGSGTNSLNAVYSGDSTHASSTSSTTSFTVSGSSLTAAASPLVITTTDAPINTSITLATTGGNGSGAITYNVANGTATGCSVSGATLSVPTNVSGTCFVLATQASAGTYLGDSSNVTTVNFFWRYAGTYGVVSDNYSYSCNSGDTLNGTECNHSYAATPNYTCSVGTLQSNNTCTYSATISSYSCSVGTLSGTNCLYSATISSYSCPGGWSQNGSECSRVAGTYSSQANCQAAGNANLSSGSWVAYNCTGSGSSWTLRGFINATPNYTCPSGGTLSGSSCVIPATPNYTCPSGGSLSGSNCVNLAATISSYSCPSGGSLSGSSCVNLAATISSYSCPSGGSLSGSTCTIVNDYAATPTVTSYNYGYNCPIGGSLGSSATICSISGGSGPNLRHARNELFARLRDRSLANSMKGVS